jgi:hypothetical protein
MKLIDKKKQTFKVNSEFRQYLKQFQRYLSLPVIYDDLLRYKESVPYYDRNDKDTLWVSVYFESFQQSDINKSLIQTYSLLKADGEISFIDHLKVDRIDLCLYGNTQPFRIRILNTINENFDYFYIKKADASRLYGLELEHILSPNRINFLYDKNTLIEEHISGVPADMFIENYLTEKFLDEVRLAKEFVKFNERCFIRLLGDMHSSNYVVEITPDFEETIYRLRPIDFDQQSYEGKKKIYLPQYFKENNPIIFLGIKYMSPETVYQYQMEERSLIYKRINTSAFRLNKLLDVMCKDRISSDENVLELRSELSEHYESTHFLKCKTMGEVLKASLKQLKTTIEEHQKNRKQRFL